MAYRLDNLTLFMKQYTSISLTFAALMSFFASPTVAQTVSQPSQSNRNAIERGNAPSLRFVYGTVSNLDRNQFTLNHSNDRVTITTGQYAINLAPNEPIAVTGAFNPQTGQLEAYSITRSTGTNITLHPKDASIFPPIPGLSELSTKVIRVQ